MKVLRIRFPTELLVRCGRHVYVHAPITNGLAPNHSACINHESIRAVCGTNGGNKIYARKGCTASSVANGAILLGGHHVTLRQSGCFGSLHAYQIGGISQVGRRAYSPIALRMQR
jgi:hypothetical protein